VAILDYATHSGSDRSLELSADSVIEVAATPVFGPDEAIEAMRCAGDWVLLRLVRPVARTLAPIEFTTPRSGAPAYALGHPLGLPLKLAQGGRVLGVEGATFRATLDTYTGSSGSPVFDADSHALIGIVSEGPPGVGDFTAVLDRKCYAYRRIDGAAPGTVCVAASCFSSSVTDHLARSRP
jgi:hypothetical protein